MRILTVLIVCLSVLALMSGMSKIAQIDAMIGRMMAADQIRLSSRSPNHKFTVDEYLDDFSAPMMPPSRLTFGPQLMKISSGS